MIAGPMLGITGKKNQKMEPFPADGQKNINALSEVGRVMEQGANAPHGCSLIPVAHFIVQSLLMQSCSQTLRIPSLPSILT